MMLLRYLLIFLLTALLVGTVFLSNVMDSIASAGDANDPNQMNDLDRDIVNNAFGIG